ncbi:MAG: phosphohydrolase [Candidatus Saccharibacteria bacterium]
MNTLTLDMLKNNPVVKLYMDEGNKFIGTTGAIEHNISHAQLISDLSYEILYKLGYPKREAELAAIAGYVHDIGNLVNRYWHGTSGAIMVFDILLDMDVDPDEVTMIMGAIGTHEEHAGGHPVNNVAAAVILADKSDVNRSRVRKQDAATFTTRDRVNYAAQESSLEVDAEARRIVMKLKIDVAICSVMEYFEIFLTKMMMCKRAAEFLDCTFELVINDVRLL